MTHSRSPVSAPEREGLCLFPRPAPAEPQVLPQAHDCSPENHHTLCADLPACEGGKGEMCGGGMREGCEGVCGGMCGGSM